MLLSVWQYVYTYYMKFTLKLAAGAAGSSCTASTFLSSVSMSSIMKLSSSLRAVPTRPSGPSSAPTMTDMIGLDANALLNDRSAVLWAIAFSRLPPLLCAVGYSDRQCKRVKACNAADETPIHCSRKRCAVFRGLSSCCCVAAAAKLP
jgi:hypothetical protein